MAINKKSRREYRKLFGINDDPKKCLENIRLCISAYENSEPIDNDSYNQAVLSAENLIDLSVDGNILDEVEKAVVPLLEIPLINKDCNLLAFIQALLPYKQSFSEDTVASIECKITDIVLDELKKGPDSLVYSRAVFAADPELFKKIIKDRRCKKSWFVKHTYKDGGIQHNVPGIHYDPNDDFCEVIDEIHHPKWKVKQSVNMMDVLGMSYLPRKGWSAGAESHAGTVNRELGNRKQKSASLAFKSQIWEIPIDTRKDHKTPDYYINNSDGKTILFIECKSKTTGTLKDIYIDAVEHSDDKEKGYEHYTKKLILDDNVERIACSIQDFRPDIEQLTDEEIFNIIAGIDVSEDSKVGCFLLIILDHINGKHRMIAIIRKGHNLPDVFTKDVTIFNCNK